MTVENNVKKLDEEIVNVDPISSFSFSSSPTLTNLVTALVAARSKFKPIPKDKVNPHYRNKYASLDAILTATMPSLLKEGLIVTQLVEGTLQEPILTTRLYHTSGEYLEGKMTLSKAADMQKLGSAITYGRRYCLSALLSISADEDDDGNAASGSGNTNNTSNTISEAQAKRLLAISKSEGWEASQVSAFLKSKKIGKSTDIKKSDYDGICKALADKSIKDKFIK